MVLLDICICIIVYLIGYNLKFIFKDFTKIDRKFLTQLFFYHILVAVAFHFYISINGGDALYYWNFPKTATLQDIFDVIDQGSASGIIYLINYVPSKILGLSFFTGNMMYSLLGFTGFIYFYRIINLVVVDVSALSRVRLLGIPIYPWIWFLPNLHFWSSGIGKDSILFFCIALFAYSLINIKKSIFGIVVSLLLSLVIRPHITLFLLVSFGIAYVVDGQLKMYKKIIICLFFAIGFVSMFNYVMEFAQLESLESSAIENYTSSKATSLNDSNSESGIDISNYPFPLKVFTFIYRPMFFDTNGLLSIVASFENLLLIIFSIGLIKKRPFRAFRKANYLIKGSFVYFLAGAFSFSMILGNLGIMLRQKNMFIPAFILFGLWVYYYFTLTENKGA